jgi:tetratricopeptide (TPR) repeat protein
VLEAIERKFGEYPVVNVYALSGFGKSYVARQFLEGESRQGIWIDCARAASLLEIFRTITETTSPSADGIPADVDNPSVTSESVKEGLRSQVTALLGTGNYLIVLDNLEQAEISRGVGEWLTSLSFPARVLTTSISRLGLDQTRVAQVQLPEMPESEARELLNSAAERELTPAEWRGLEGVHHYPLLVNLACQHVRECVRLGLPIAGSWRKVFQKAGSRTLTSGKNRHASLTAAVEYTLAQQPPWENRFVSCLSLLPWPASTEMVEMLQREMPDKSDYDPHRVWGSPFRKGGAAERERTVPASLFQLEDAVKPELSRRLTDQERQEFDRLLVTCMTKILLTKGSEDRSFLKKEWENYKYCLGIDQRQSAPMLLRDAPKVIVGMAMWYPELVSDCARLTKGLLESLSKCPASIEKAECDARKAELWNNLGVCYQFAGRFEDAEKCLRDSADLWETLVVEKERQGEDARNVRESIAKTNNSLGWVLHLKSIYREEVDTTALTHALTCFDRVRRNSGADSERAACYSNRGVALFRQGRFSEAEAELANAVALLNAKVDELIRDCADRLGTRHSPDECEKLRIVHLAKIEHTARAYNRRVMVYLAQADQPGKTDDAKSDLRMCKGILDRTEDKSEICVMLNNMALFYLLTGKPLAAEEALRMIHVYQDVYDRAADVFQNNLGIAYVLQGNYSEAVAAFRRGRDRCRVDSAQPESSLHPKVIAANLEKAERFRIKAMKGMPLEVHTPKRGKGCGAPSVGCWRPRVEVAVGSVRFECLWRWAES